MAHDPTPRELHDQLTWPFGEQFLGGRQFLARMERRPFAVLATPRGSYQFYARTDRANRDETWTEVVYAPNGVRSMHLPVIFKRRESGLGHGMETVDVALEVIAAHLAAGQPVDWEDADIDDEDEPADD